MSEAALIRAHRLAQIKNGGLAAALMLAISDELKTGRLSNDAFVVEAVAGLKLTHAAAARLARRHLEETRALVGVDGPIVEAEFDGSLAYGKATWTVTDLERLKRTEERNWEQDFQRITSRLASWADWYAKMAGRDTVVSSAEAAGTGWRRVTDGNPCAFCAMLAGRGPVYASKEAASVAVSRDRRRKRPFGDKYHQHCGCTVVEQHGEWVPTTEEQRYVEAYNEAADAGGTSDVLAHMREHGAFNDSPAPKTQSGSFGGRGTHPPDSRKGTPEPDPWPDRIAGNHRGEGSVLVPTGMRVSAHEMATARTLADLGATVRFREILDRRNATNPDAWIDERLWEFKAPEGSSEKNTIAKQFSRGKKQANHLVIDLRRCGLPDDLAAAQIRRRFYGTRPVASVLVILHDETVFYLT